MTHNATGKRAAILAREDEEENRMSAGYGQKGQDGSHNSVIKTKYSLLAENGWRQSWRVFLTQVYGIIVDFLTHSRRRKVNGWFLWRKRSKVPEKHYLDPSQEGGKLLVMATDTESESLEKDWAENCWETFILQ